MEPSSSNGSNVPLPASQHPLHATDADEEDESVENHHTANVGGEPFIYSAN